MKQQKLGRAGIGAGEVFVKMVEKEQLPDFCFLEQGGIGVWRSEQTGFCSTSTKTSDIRESRGRPVASIPVTGSQNGNPGLFDQQYSLRMKLR
jgi:hypothetical protein